MTAKETVSIRLNLTQQLADAINRDLWSFGYITEAALEHLPRFKEGDEVLIQAKR